MISLKNFYNIYAHRHHQGQLEHRLLGRFMLHDGNLKVLEDHGLGKDLEAMHPEDAQGLIEALSRGQRTQVVNLDDIRQGQHPDLLPEKAPGPVPEDIRDALARGFKDPKKVSRFEYHRDGLPNPQTLEVVGDRASLDGMSLSGEELKHIQTSVKSGKAKLRNLMKTEDGQRVDAGARRWLTEDALTGLRNLAEYRDFLATGKPGIYVHLGLNDTGDLNERHGYHWGDKVIAGAGAHIQDTAREVAGQSTPVFRTGGDRFAIHLQDPDQAATFLRALRTKFEAIPPIRGTHNLAYTAGWGQTPETAELSFRSAHATRVAANEAPGNSQSYAASGMTGPAPSSTGHTAP